MEKVKEYKPIVVVYADLFSFSVDTSALKDGLNKAGYENILVFGALDIEPRVEIISVDKATVVEDIRKYINDNLPPREDISVEKEFSK